MPHLILYDGVCGLCNRLNLFVLKRDAADLFRFASLQSDLGIGAVRRHGRDAVDLDTVYVIENYGTEDERLRAKARAVLFIVRSLGGVWRLASLLDRLPTPLLDAVYDFVAKRRYGWFGRSEVCIVPKPEHRAKFLE